MAPLLSARGAEPQPQKVHAHPAANQEEAAAAEAAAGAAAGAAAAGAAAAAEGRRSGESEQDPLERSVHFPPRSGDPLELSLCAGAGVGSTG